ncbi:MAG: hypothetical protein LBM69_08055 [Lachnospiraceae bacterium]|nr:hypothetical protein [Lachnospiraceae bacterium]
MKVSELSNALISTRAIGAQTGASLKVRKLLNALIRRAPLAHRREQI